MATYNAMVRGIPEGTYATLEGLAEQNGTSINKIILRTVIDALGKPSAMGNVRIYSCTEACVECGNIAEYGRVTMDGRIVGPYCITHVEEHHGTDNRNQSQG